MAGPHRRAWFAIELALVVVIAFMVGRLTAPSKPTASPGRVDVGFAQDMAVHHEQAILMSSLAQTRGGVAVKALAAAILTTQSEEVGLLRGWLTLWHEPSADPSPMSWMPGHGGHAAMPGMASPGQLTELSTRSGKSFDVLFLQLMIRHHEGGIEMAQYAQAHARTAAVRDAAKAMALAQIEDLGQLRPLLTADGAKELSPP